MEVQRKVFEFVSKELVPEAGISFDPSASLLDAGLDSVAMMELIVWIEDEFKVSVDAEDLTPENFSTLDAIAAYLGRAVAA